MSRSAADARNEMLSLMPPGWIWPKAGDGSLLGAILAAPATLIAEIEGVAEEMIDQVDPRTATYTLGDYERVLGPDPCGRDTADMSIYRRQQLAHQRWTARGGQSIPYYVDYAAKRGVTITIQEATLSRAGVMQAGDELVNHPCEFVWRVRLATGNTTIFRAGESVAGDPVYGIELSDIECDLRRLKPAHTEVIFSYFAPLTDDAVTWLGGGITVDGVNLTLESAES